MIWDKGASARRRPSQAEKRDHLSRMAEHGRVRETMERACACEWKLWTLLDNATNQLRLSSARKEGELALQELEEAGKIYLDGTTEGKVINAESVSVREDLKTALLEATLCLGQTPEEGMALRRQLAIETEEAHKEEANWSESEETSAFYPNCQEEIGDPLSSDNDDSVDELEKLFDQDFEAKKTDWFHELNYAKKRTKELLDLEERVASKQELRLAMSRGELALEYFEDAHRAVLLCALTVAQIEDAESEFNTIKERMEIALGDAVVRLNSYVDGPSDSTSVQEQEDGRDRRLAEDLQKKYDDALAYKEELQIEKAHADMEFEAADGALDVLRAKLGYVGELQHVRDPTPEGPRPVPLGGATDVPVTHSVYSSEAVEEGTNPDVKINYTWLQEFDENFDVYRAYKEVKLVELPWQPCQADEVVHGDLGQESEEKACEVQLEVVEDVPDLMGSIGESQHGDLSPPEQPQPTASKGALPVLGILPIQPSTMTEAAMAANEKENASTRGPTVVKPKGKWIMEWTKKDDETGDAQDQMCLNVQRNFKDELDGKMDQLVCVSGKVPAEKVWLRPSGKDHSGERIRPLKKYRSALVRLKNVCSKLDDGQQQRGDDLRACQMVYDPGGIEQFALEVSDLLGPWRQIPYLYIEHTLLDVVKELPVEDRLTWRRCSENPTHKRDESDFNYPSQ
ncbi:unnamed protein product [Sphagnum tenellum]